jgi:hypothetical protein
VTNHSFMFRRGIEQFEAFLDKLGEVI